MRRLLTSLANAWLARERRRIPYDHAAADAEITAWIRARIPGLPEDPNEWGSIPLRDLGGDR